MSVLGTFPTSRCIVQKIRGLSLSRAVLKSREREAIVERPAEPTSVASPNLKRRQATDRHAARHWGLHCRCLDLKMHLSKNNIIPTGLAPGWDISGRKVPNLETAPAPDGLPGHLSNPGWDKISPELPNLAGGA